MRVARRLCSDNTSFKDYIFAFIGENPSLGLNQIADVDALNW